MAETLSEDAAGTDDARDLKLAIEAAEMGAWLWDVAAGELSLSAATRERQS
jgi:hypothetical protein